MGFYTSSYLAGKRQELLNDIVRIQYQRNNSQWNNGVINSKVISGNNVVIMVNAPSSGVNDTITGARALDKDGTIIGQQSMSLARTSLNAALLKLTFPIIET